MLDPKSRMRESRTSGSVGGLGGNSQAYPTVYGQPTIRSQNGSVVAQSPVGNPYLFTGREYDPETGLYFYRARTYDPVTGRFLQRDPLGPLCGLSLHEYAMSSPVGHVDPTGRSPEDIRTRMSPEMKLKLQAIEDWHKKHGSQKEVEHALEVANRSVARLEAWLSGLQSRIDELHSELSWLHALQDRAAAGVPCTWARDRIKELLAQLNDLYGKLAKAKAALAEAQEDRDDAYFALRELDRLTGGGWRRGPNGDYADPQLSGQNGFNVWTSYDGDSVMVTKGSEDSPGMESRWFGVALDGKKNNYQDGAGLSSSRGGYATEYGLPGMDRYLHYYVPEREDGTPDFWESWKSHGDGTNLFNPHGNRIVSDSWR